MTFFIVRGLQRYNLDLFNAKFGGGVGI